MLAVVIVNMYNVSMSKPTYYLIGGGEFDDPVEKRVEFQALKKLNKPAQVLIIPWTSNDPEKSARYRPQMTKLFENCNTASIEYLEESDSPEVADKKFAAATVLYLPGAHQKS